MATSSNETPPITATPVVLGHVKWTSNLCANVTPDGTFNCSNGPTMLCTGCRLVGYCSYECQMNHWHSHQPDCVAHRDIALFLPAWAKANRSPSAVLPGNLPNDQKRLWGRNRAQDILKLESNEGEDYAKDLVVYFNGCIDLRDVVQTVNAVPDQYQGTIDIFVNSHSEPAAIRNALILMVALTNLPEQAADLIIHLWYSAFLTEPMLQNLRNKLNGRLNKTTRDVLNGRTSNTVHAVTGPFGGTTTTSELNLELEARSYTSLLQLLNVNNNTATAKQHRATAMSQVDFMDNHDYYLYNMSPQYRLSTRGYLQTGILAPFGACLEAFNAINPTVFNKENAQGASKFKLLSFEKPMDGWDVEEIVSCNNGRANSNDLCGQLYHHLYAKLTKFCTRIASGLEIRFHVSSLRPHEPPTKLLKGLCGGCDRIYLAAPVIHLDPRVLKTLLVALSPYLQRQASNNFATIIALYEVDDDYTRTTTMTKKERKEIEPRLQQYGYLKPSLTTPEGFAYKIQIYYAALILRQFDEYFDDWMTKNELGDIVAAVKLKIRGLHKVVDRWPRRFESAAADPGAQATFRYKLAEWAVFAERAVEFRSRN